MTWWADLYDDALADVLLERTDGAATDRTVGFLRRVLAIEPGDRVLDQCCGIGSLAIPLARAGFEVIGVDQAARYIERATEAARAAGVDAKFFSGDAFTWRPDRMCNAAFNWWTSFGYAARDADNLQMLKRAAQAIVPGGRFALDFMNVPQVLRGFRPTVTIERAGIKLTRETTLDLAAGTMHKTWHYELPTAASHSAAACCACTCHRSWSSCCARRASTTSSSTATTRASHSRSTARAASPSR